MNLGALMALQVASFWPVWTWYAARITDGSDEPWGVFALLTALLLVWRERAHANSNQRVPVPAVVGQALYLLSLLGAPAIVRAALALASLSFTASAYFFRKPFHLGLAALLVLSLPLIASLQFYLGYPLRVVTSYLVAALVSFIGQPTAAVGNLLLWRGDYISVDAPCSGIKMLWSGLYCAFALASFSRLSNFRTWISYVSAGCFIFFANVLRTTTLFFTESRLIPAPAWFHQAAGLMAFCCVLSAIVLLNRSLARGFVQLPECRNPRSGAR